jgi:hypothetical protein
VVKVHNAFMDQSSWRETERHAEGVNRVMNLTGPELRGLPVEQAERRLRAAFRDHDVSPDEDTVRWLARHAADPWEWVKNPIGYLRAQREHSKRSKLDDQRRQAEADQEDRQVREVSRRIFEAFDSPEGAGELTGFRISALPGDGEKYEVLIWPYTARSAERVKRAAKPAAVSVRPPH